MAMKQLRDYYVQVEKLYLELSEDLKEMEEDLKKGECTEEELQKLLIPVNQIKDNYRRLSYCLYLLYQPNRKEKTKNYERANKDLKNYFEANNLTVEQELKNEYASLQEFRKLIKEKFKHE